MKTALANINELFSHPAPGLAFAMHDRPPLPRRTHPSRHQWQTTITAQERHELETLIAGAPELADLRALYERSNGVDLFYLKCPHCDEPHWMLSLLPFHKWAEASAPWQTGDCASFMEECELYKRGTWRVIASLPGEGMSLVQFFSGEYEDQPLAGKIFCIGLDGYLGFEEEVAPNLSALLDEITRDPAAFFNRLGFSWVVDIGDRTFGDVIEKYIANSNTESDLQPWPPTKPRD